MQALLVALSFHQYFEGIALGARLTDADLGSATDAVFATVFAVAAPVGIGVGVGLAS